MTDHAALPLNSEQGHSERMNRLLMNKGRAPRWLAKLCREASEANDWIVGEDLKTPLHVVAATAALLAGGWWEPGAYRGRAMWLDHPANQRGETWDQDVFVSEPYRSAFYPEGQKQLERFAKAIGVPFQVTEPGDWHPDTVRISIFNPDVYVMKRSEAKQMLEDGLERGLTKKQAADLVRQEIRRRRKEQRMASAFEATVQIYRNEQGVSIVTDALTLETFHASLAKIAQDNDFSEADWGRLYPEINRIENSLNGFSSKGAEQRRLLIAGQMMPPAIDLVVATGPGLPTVELASSNGEVVG